MLQKLPASRFLTSLLCLIPSVVPAAETVWNFSDSANRFQAASGMSSLTYHDPDNLDWGDSETTFGSASSLNLPPLPGGDFEAMGFPATSTSQGYQMIHNFPENGTFIDDSLTSNYTIIFDILFPSTNGSQALVQTDITNESEAEFSRREQGLGVNGNFRGKLTANQWHRIAWTVRAAEGEGQAVRYVDGQFIGAIGTTGSGLGRRFALENDLLLFTDSTGQESGGFVSSIGLYDRVLTPAEIRALGGAHAGGVSVPGAAPAAPEKVIRPMKLIAHRGASGVAPENTIVAIDRAFELGADGVEIDIRLSEDNVAILMHDETVDRTSDGTEFTDSLTVEDLKQLDAGSWFDPSFAGEKVPTLAQALTAAKGKGIVYLDLKENGLEVAILTAVAQAQFPLSDLWICVRDDLFLAAELVGEYPEARPLFSNPPATWREIPNYFDQLRAANAVGFSQSLSNADPFFVERVRREGLVMEFFTILDPESAAFAGTLGANYIETDFPGEIRKYLLSPGTNPTDPSPVDDGVARGLSTVLSWLPAQKGPTETEDVFFGTNNPPALVGTSTTGLFPIPELEPDVTYFWKIDDGPVWSFQSRNPFDEELAVFQEWDFAGSLDAVLGDSILTFAGDSADLVAFETTDGTTVPHLNGEPTPYLRVPAFPQASQGLDLELLGVSPPDETSSLRQYSLIYDLFVPGPLNWIPFFNTNTDNTDDSDFFIRADGAVGIGAIGYSPAGSIQSGTWHRVIVSGDQIRGVARYFVDGELVFVRQGSPQDSGRFVINLSQDLPSLRLLGDNSGETTEVLVSRFAFVNQAITSREATALGAARTAGIFENPAAPQLTAKQTTTPQLRWPSLPWTDDMIEISASLREADWREIENAPIRREGASRVFEPEITNEGRNFFRIRRQAKGSQ